MLFTECHRKTASAQDTEAGELRISKFDYYFSPLEPLGGWAYNLKSSGK